MNSDHIAHWRYYNKVSYVLFLTDVLRGCARFQYRVMLVVTYAFYVGNVSNLACVLVVCSFNYLTWLLL